MTKLFLSGIVTLFCSASFALHKQVSQEIRGTETWVNVSLDMSSSSKADMLFVIDDSGSMGTHQAHLAQQMDLVATNLSFYSDLNAAVITSSMNINAFNPGAPSDGKFVGPVLNSSSPLFVGELSKQIQVGTNGSATEQFFAPIFAATSEPLISTTNAGFLRPDADLLIVLLTDTEDQSSITAADIHSHLVALKPNNTINVISVGITDPAKCSGESDLTKLTGIKDFVTISKGQTVDLCSDFSQEIPKAISVIKENISEVSLSTFPNTKIDFKSVKVEADGKTLLLGDVLDGWVYDSNKSVIILGTNVVANKTIHKLNVSYQLLPL